MLFFLEKIHQELAASMTIPTSASATLVAGTGSATAFNFNFVGDSASVINVSLVSSTGSVTPLQPSQYSITLNVAAPNQLWGIGGVVTYPLTGSPLAAGNYLLIQRQLPYTQQVSIQNQGNFYAQVTEQAIDIIEMQLQQLISRTGQFRGTWATLIRYNFGDYIIDGVNGLNTQNYYMCIVPNTSGVWATDLTNGDWTLVINIASINASVTAAAASAAAAAGSASSASSSASSASSNASSASISATNASNSATAAAASAAAAAGVAGGFSATSTTSLAIATGAKTFTIQSGKLFTAGQFLQIASNASALNYMHGTITSYSGTSLVMNITDIGGSGTHADWNISLSGSQGPTGPSSGGTVTTTGSPANGNLTKFSGATSITNADLTGDITTSGALATTLAIVNSNVGSFTNASIAVNGKGLITAASNGVGDGGITRRQVFNSSGTYTPDAHMITCELWGIAGGGGGGGVAGGLNSIAGGGGAAGSEAKRIVTAATIGASQTVTIGASGTAGTNTGGTGGTGGTTSVGTLISCLGGLGGVGSPTSSPAVSGGAGQNATSGDVNGRGAGGGAGTGGAGSNEGFSGAGGNSSIGGGGQGLGGNNAGVAGATNTGGGGSGAITNNDTTARTGGAGGSGIVIITEYCSQ